MIETSRSCDTSTVPPAEKRVVWAELFFDLVFVLAITQVSSLLHADLTWSGAGRALLAFIPIYWAWVGTSVHANTHDVDNPLDRLGVFAVGLCGLLMALAVPHAYGDRGALFGAGYLTARIVLALLVTRGPLAGANHFTVAAAVTGPLMLAGGVLDRPARVALWGLAAAIDLATPALVRRRLSRVSFNAEHLPERFGLLLIIALGEAIASVGLPASRAHHLTAGTITAVAGAYLLACGLWWVYFHFAADAIRHGLATAVIRGDVVREVLAYAHLGFVGGVIAAAVGLGEVVLHPGDRLPASVTALLFGGCALFLGTFGFTRWRLFRKRSTTRVTAAVILLATMPAGPRVPGLAALAIVVTVVAALNVYEYVRVRRHGDITRVRDAAAA